MSWTRRDAQFYQNTIDPTRATDKEEVYWWDPHQYMQHICISRLPDRTCSINVDELDGSGFEGHQLYDKLSALGLTKENAPTRLYDTAGMRVIGNMRMSRINGKEGDKQLGKFISVCMEHFKLLDTDMHRELLAFCRLPAPLSIETNQVKALLDSDKVDDAVELAKQYQQDRHLFEPIWWLAEKLFKRLTKSPHQINSNIKKSCYDCYNAVSSSSPHFKEAQSQCGHILLIRSEEAEKHERHDVSILKQIIRHFVAAGDLPLANKFLHQVSGQPLGEMPFQFEEASVVNLDMIFAMADIMRKMQEQMAALMPPSGAKKGKADKEEAARVSPPHSPRMYASSKGKKDKGGEPALPASPRSKD